MTQGYTPQSTLSNRHDNKQKYDRQEQKVGDPMANNLKLRMKRIEDALNPDTGQITWCQIVTKVNAGKVVVIDESSSWGKLIIKDNQNGTV